MRPYKIVCLVAYILLSLILSSCGGSSQDLRPKLNMKWAEQPGASGRDVRGSGISVDSAGNSYVAGSTFEGLPGQTQYGHEVYFIAKHNASGALQWTNLALVAKPQ